MLASLLKLPKYMETTYFKLHNAYLIGMLDGKDILTTDDSFDNLLNNIQMSLFLHPQCVSLFFPQIVARYIKDITKWPEDINNFPVVKAFTVSILFICF